MLDTCGQSARGRTYRNGGDSASRITPDQRPRLPGVSLRSITHAAGDRSGHSIIGCPGGMLRRITIGRRRLAVRPNRDKYAIRWPGRHHFSRGCRGSSTIHWWALSARVPGAQLLCARNKARAALGVRGQGNGPKSQPWAASRRCR